MSHIDMPLVVISLITALASLASTVLDLLTKIIEKRR
jgi:hypothetical protein